MECSIDETFFCKTGFLSMDPTLNVSLGQRYETETNANSHPEGDYFTWSIFVMASLINYKYSFSIFWSTQVQWFTDHYIISSFCITPDGVLEFNSFSIIHICHVSLASWRELIMMALAELTSLVRYYLHATHHVRIMLSHEVTSVVRWLRLVVRVETLNSPG